MVIANMPSELYGGGSYESVVRTMKVLHDVLETESNGKRVLVMSHFAGRKYSLLVGIMYETLFARYGARVKFVTNENHVTFTIE